jgi:hypothetical protein
LDDRSIANNDYQTDSASIYSNENLLTDENEFWMSYEDAVRKFTAFSVCKAVNMEEMRLRGKFLRIKDIHNSNIETVISKWYYSLEVKHRTLVFIGIHQEDERRLGVFAKRPYLEAGIVVLRRLGGGLELVDLRDFQQTRQCELELTLEPGSYIVVPRTTGCTLRPPAAPKDQQL